MDINHSWKATCRIVLGEEVGDIDDYRDYLLQYITEPKSTKSYISGRDVIVPDNDNYCDKKFISNDEREQYASLMSDLRLNIDEIKDLDSVTEALNEIVYYAGNVVLGNSKVVEQSNRISNSSFVYHSEGISDSKYVGYCGLMRYGDHVFGCSTGGDVRFSIKAFEFHKTVRCFETLRVYTSSDCFYSSNMEGCTSCMFSFNQRNRRNLVGNLQLPPDKYQSIRSKLIEDIRNDLREKKKVMSIVELIGGSHG